MAKRKLLIQRADRLGDVVFTLPMLEALANSQQNLEIHYLVSSISEELLIPHPMVSKVLVYDSKKSFRQLVSEVRRESYDAVIHSWNDPKMVWVGLLAGIPIRIGDRSNPSLAWMYTHKVDQDWANINRHQIEFNLQLLRPLGLYVSWRRASVYTSSYTDDRAEVLLEPLLLLRRPLVVILCSTGGSSAPMPESAMVQFVKRLSDMGHFSICLTGHGDIAGFSEFSLEHGVVNLCNKTTLGEMFSILKRADFVVGGDTGTLHVASMLNKPILFFSPYKAQLPTRWGPLSDNIVIVRKDYLSPLNFRQERRSQSVIADGNYLYDQFCTLLYHHEMGISFSLDDIKELHQRHSFRFLYTYSDVQEFEALYPALAPLREEGIIVVSLYVGKWRWLRFYRILNVILEKNITIVLGASFSGLFRWMIRFLLEFLYQYRSPRFISCPLSVHITGKELLQISENAWANVPLHQDL